MNKTKWKNKSISSLLANFLRVVIFAVAAILILISLTNIEKSSSQEGKLILQESLRRAAVSCYAIEGSYPSSLDYLADNYGVIIDEKKYEVHYEVFASNIMPVITVVPMED